MSSALIRLDEADQPLDIDFHPSREELILCSGISGKLIISDLIKSSASDNVECGKTRFVDGLFEDSVRACGWHCVSTLGGVVAGGVEYGWIYYDVEAGREILRVEEAHEFSISRLMSLHENLFATGDDEGLVKIWDGRSGKEVRKYHDNEEYIADFAYNPDRKTLIAAGGDGYLTVFDIRKKELLARSDNLETELLSVEIIKGGKKVAVGMEDGFIGVFNWGDWGDYKDRICGHPLSVDAIVKYDENTILTGSSDGMIRVLDVYPTKFAGVIGDQGEFPVENLKLSCNKKYLASISHDSCIRVWDMDEEVQDEQVESDGEEASTACNENKSESSDSDFDEPKVKQKAKRQKTSSKKTLSSFFDDLESD